MAVYLKETLEFLSVCREVPNCSSVDIAGILQINLLPKKQQSPEPDF